MASTYTGPTPQTVGVEWIFKIPATWQVLSDGRVVSGEGKVWTPKGEVYANFVLTEIQKSLTEFVGQPFGSDIDIGILEKFNFDYNTLTMVSPQGWIYYLREKLLVTPAGDIWWNPLFNETKEI